MLPPTFGVSDGALRHEVGPVAAVGPLVVGQPLRAQLWLRLTVGTLDEVVGAALSGREQAEAVGAGAAIPRGLH